ncbi:MAG: zf-HC2 domain-containing protein [Acidobacteriota bacterium]|nr:zf-HC2 domain-containing protein [Acidobacteriota bacterium]
MSIHGRREARIGCMRVARVLQAYLDGEIDEVTARRVSGHLDGCRRCGMKAHTYRAIKDSIARTGSLDELARRRLEEFAQRVSSLEPGA